MTEEEKIEIVLLQDAVSITLAGLIEALLILWTVD